MKFTIWLSAIKFLLCVCTLYCFLFSHLSVCFYFPMENVHMKCFYKKKTEKI